jgi:hypothetical protein
MNFTFGILQWLLYGVTTSVLRTCLPIMSSMRAQNTLKWIYHFVRECVAKRLLDIWFISTNDQVADGFTKALLCHKLQAFQFNISLGWLRLAGGGGGYPR